MLDNAGFFMLMALAFNVFKDQRFILALSFLCISMSFQYIANSSDIFHGVLYYALSATAHMVFIVICSRININDQLVRFMMIISGLGLVLQLFGVLSWYWGNGLGMYFLLSELIFALEIIGFIYGGVERNYIDSAFYNNDSILHSFRDKAL